MEDLENIETIFDHCKDKETLFLISGKEEKEAYLKHLENSKYKNDEILYDLYLLYKVYLKNIRKSKLFYSKINENYIYIKSRRA